MLANDPSQCWEAETDRSLNLQASQSNLFDEHQARETSRLGKKKLYIYNIVAQSHLSAQKSLRKFTLAMLTWIM